jgi:hypothetical protein
VRSIESKHGLDEPGHEPSTRAERMVEAGKQVSSCGGSIVRLGCSGFLLLFVVAVVVAVLSGGSSGSTPAPTGTTGSERTATPPPELRIGSAATLEGEQSGERVEATVLAYKESIRVGEYDTPQAGMRFVGVTLRLKNVGTASYSDSPSNGATILTPTGEHAKTAVVTEGECSEGFADSVRIAPGESQEGCIPFELAEDATAAKLQWTPSSGYGEETAEWSLFGTPAPGEAPRLKVGPGTGSGATSCGEGLGGSEDTSCPFAREALKAFVAEYVIKGAPPAEISARSPVTHRTYELGCEIVSEDTEVECDTGTATVVFPLAEVEKYKTEEESLG